MDKRKLMYSILKELEHGNEPKYSDYGVSLDYFGDTVDMMQNSKMISGADVIRAGIGHEVKMTFLKKTKVELKGCEYLEENSSWAKAYKGLKEVLDFIKL